MTKKAKKPEPKKEQMTVDDLLVGNIVPDLHGVDITIDDDLIDEMRQFEKEGKTHAIYRGNITGSFLFWQMNKDKPKTKKKAKKPKKAEEVIEIEDLEEETIEELTDEGWGTEEELEEIEETTKLDEAIEEQVVDEENLKLDAIEDYKVEFNVKNVKTNSKKFKTFFEEWKQSD